MGWNASPIKSHVMHRWDGKEAMREAEGRGFERVTCDLGRCTYVRAFRRFVIIFFLGWTHLVPVAATGRLERY
jgi:hypothetical protein